MEEREGQSVPDPLTAAHRRRSSRRHVPPNIRCSPNCGLWPQDQAERLAIGAGEVVGGPRTRSSQSLGRAFVSPPTRPETASLADRCGNQPFRRLPSPRVSSATPVSPPMVSEHHQPQEGASTASLRTATQSPTGSITSFTTIPRGLAAARGTMIRKDNILADESRQRFPWPVYVAGAAICVAPT